MARTDAALLVSLAEQMSLEEVRAISNIVNIGVHVDPANPLDNLMLWLCEVISKIMTVRNTDQTEYSEEVEKDIELALYHLVDKDSLKEFEKTDLDELQKVRDATKDVLNTHFKETFTGTVKYSPIDDLPLIEWAWSRGSLLMRLSEFTSLFFMANELSKTKH